MKQEKNKIYKINIEDIPEICWEDENKLKEHLRESETSFIKKRPVKDWKTTENKVWNHYVEGQEYFIFKRKYKVLKKAKHGNNNSKSDVFLTLLDIIKNKEVSILIQVKQDNYVYTENWTDLKKLLNKIERFRDYTLEEKKEAKQEVSDFITLLKKNKKKFIDKIIKVQKNERARTAPNIITNCRYLTGIGMCFSVKGQDEYKIKSSLLKKIMTEGMDEGIDSKIISLLGKDEEYEPERHDIDMTDYYKNRDIYFEPRPIYSISGFTQNRHPLWIDYDFCQSINHECHKIDPTILPPYFLNLLEDAIKNERKNFEYNNNQYILQEKYKNLNCYYPEI